MEDEQNDLLLANIVAWTIFYLSFCFKRLNLFINFHNQKYIRHTPIFK